MTLFISVIIIGHKIYAVPLFKFVSNLLKLCLKKKNRLQSLDRNDLYVRLSPEL